MWRWQDAHSGAVQLRGGGTVEGVAAAGRAGTRRTAEDERLYMEL